MSSKNNEEDDYMHGDFLIVCYILFEKAMHS